MKSMEEITNTNIFSSETSETADLMKNGHILRKEKENDLSKEKMKYIKTMMKEVLYNSLAQACIKLYQTKYFTLKTFLFVTILVLKVLASYMVIQSNFGQN